MPSIRAVNVADDHELRAVNDLFLSNDLEPITVELPDQQVQGIYADGELVGALHASAPFIVAHALVQAGAELEQAAATAGRMQAIESLAVAAYHRGKGYGAELIQAASNFARNEFDAEILLAKISVTDADLIRWYTQIGFSVCAPGQAIQVDDVRLPNTSDYLDAWKTLALPSSDGPSVEPVPQR